jgi:hypothetical protein
MWAVGCNGVSCAKIFKAGTENYVRCIMHAFSQHYILT